MQTYLGPTSQYFSTFLISPLNQRLLEKNRFNMILLLMIITMADHCCLFISCCFLERFSFISHCGIAFNLMLVDDSISLFNSSIFLGPKNISNDMPCTLWQCHYSGNSIPTTVWSISFAAWINKFDCSGKSIVTSTFFKKRGGMDPDGTYLT